MRVAFIGLGTMGAPMALRLLGAGHELRVFNRTPERARPLGAAGAHVAATPAVAVAGTDAVCTCVTDGRALRELALATDGLLAAAHGDGPRLWVDFSTIGPEVTVELAGIAAPHGIRFVDAPVTGGDQGAREGSLTVLVGGETADVEEAMPLLRAVGRRIEHMGPLGSGQATKLVQNLVGGVALVGAAEGLSLGRRLGLDPARLARLFSDSTADSYQLRALAGRMESGDRTPGFSAANRHKDFRLAMDMAQAVRMPAYASAAVLQAMTRVLLADLGHQDQSAVWDVLDRD
jgi:3-hydroxyisobutyrate dehydrogenase